MDNVLFGSDFKVFLYLFRLQKFSISQYTIVATVPIQTSSDISSTKWESLTKKGLRFLHINITSLFSKKDQIRWIVNKTETAIIGITETIVDHTVPDSKVNFSGYDIL